MNKMKQQSAWLVLLFLTVCLLGSLTANAKTVDEMRHKEIKKSYTVSKSDQLKVSNRFGSIVVSHWARNEVEIRVVVESKASSDERARREIDRVNIEINKADRIITAETRLGEQKGNDQNGNRGERRLTISYYISMPSYLTHELAQKYGNITLPNENNGRSTIEVKYGNVYAGNFTEELDITMKYGNLTAGNLKTARMDLGYCGNVSIGNAEMLSVVSKYSNLNLKQVDTLDLEQKYGNLNLRSADIARIEMKYSNAKLGLIKKKLDMDEMDYSEVAIEKLASSFEHVDASGRYGTLTIGLPHSASFRINAENMRYGKCSIKGFNTTHSSVVNKTEYHYEINGGKGGTIQFDGNEYSNLNVKQL
ncbi:MAG: hypothetical protein RR382_04980 [Tannerellaceae bacterium]